MIHLPLLACNWASIKSLACETNFGDRGVQKTLRAYRINGRALQLPRKLRVCIVRNSEPRNVIGIRERLVTVWKSGKGKDAESSLVSLPCLPSLSLHYYFTVRQSASTYTYIVRERATLLRSAPAL